MTPLLSICVATYNRGSFIGATLDSILDQMELSVELVIVDGASTDNTYAVMMDYVKKFPNLRYFRESENSGVDQDYDKAVGYAAGRYCWLMSDDDLLKPNAIHRVLDVIKGVGCELVVLNAELRNKDLSELLDGRRLNVAADLQYGKESNERFFIDTASYLSFIGCVVISRSAWLSRNRSVYYGSNFIHIGVIFQHPPLENIYVIADPLIVIRHGNSTWTPRSFEIWNFKWQELIYSFTDYSDSARRTFGHREPWRRFRTLLYARAMGSYSLIEFNKHVYDRLTGWKVFLAFLAAVFPVTLAHIIVVGYFALLKRSAHLALYDLSKASSSNVLSRLLARVLGV